MRFTEFFNEDNVQHLQAYIIYSKSGVWPHEFIPVECVMNTFWNFTIAHKMALKYAKLGVSGNIPGMPSIEQ